MEHATPAVILLMCLFVVPVLYYIRHARLGREIYIRRIPGVDAIDDAIGRSVELGRPISFTTGMTNVGPLLFAVLGILRYIAHKAAVFGSRMFVPTNNSEGLVLIEATMQNAYRDAKRYSNFDSGSVRFLSEEQFAFASGYMGLIHREKAGSAFLFGSFAAESLILAEAGQQVGAVQVAGTVSPEQVPFFITACDYTLIGEELYAAGAYLSHDPVQVGSLRGQDIAKLVLVALIVLGALQATYYSVLVSQATDTAQESAASQPAADLPLVRWINMPWNALFGGPAAPATSADGERQE